jgi:hypothetical protein
MHQWNKTWVEEPLPGYDQLQMGSLHAQQALDANLFSLGGHDQHLLWDGQAERPVTPTKLINANQDTFVGVRPSSPGWQLHDIFATPPPAPAPQLSDSSDEVDGEALYEITLKSNALRALRNANLCGPLMVDEVTERVGKLHVDPKTSFMSKIIGMLSPSLLGFPTNNKPRKKKVGARSMMCMDTAIRRSERPATRSSSLMTSRRAQASACKQLGLIHHENEFNDDVLNQYLRLFQEPLSHNNLHGLALLADASERPGFVLSQDDMAEMLRETPTAS